MDEEKRIVDGAVKKLLGEPEIIAHSNDESYIWNRIEKESSAHPLS